VSHDREGVLPVFRQLEEAHVGKADGACPRASSI
jgi:hypothetical protein